MFVASPLSAYLDFVIFVIACKLCNSFEALIGNRSTCNIGWITIRPPLSVFVTNIIATCHTHNVQFISKWSLLKVACDDARFLKHWWKKMTN